MAANIKVVKHMEWCGHGLF